MNLCTIASGSSGNCTYIGTENSHILIDAGISGKKVEAGLKTMDLTPSDISGIMVTHEHLDHIKGIGVLARKYGIPIYATNGTIGGIADCSSVGKIEPELYHRIESDHPFMIGDLSVEAFRISHDAAEPTGYLVRHGKKKMAVATDMGKYDDYIVDKLQDLDVLLLEANHDVRMLQAGRYPYYLKQRILGDKGHLSNELSGQLLGELLHDNIKTVILGHLSKDNNYEELAYETVRLEVTMGENPYKGNDFPLFVAPRDVVSDVVTV